MKRVKQLALVLSMALILTGCGSKALKTAYNKMQIGKEITGYKVDYRLYGTYKEKSINDIVRMQNTEGKVTVEDEILPEEEIDKNQKKINKSLYEKPEIYLKGIEKAKEKNKGEEKLGEITYTTYDITVPKKIVKEMIKYTEVKDLEVKEDINGKVYLDKDGYVYKVIYELDIANKLYLNVSYFGLDKKEASK